jgi:hypothetical protein
MQRGTELHVVLRIYSFLLRVANTKEIKNNQGKIKRKLEGEKEKKRGEKIGTS